jgi:hypothetical protein
MGRTPVVTSIVAMVLFIGGACRHDNQDAAPTRKPPSERVAIVEGGKSDWCIIVPVNATSAERLAGEEIARYIKQMTGAVLPVCTRQDHSDWRSSIDIAARGLSGDDAYTIAVGPGDQRMVSNSSSTYVSIVGSNPHSTLQAAYRFLDALGCRFLAPQFDHYRGSAEIIPHRADLSVPKDLKIESIAALRLRKLYVEEGHSHTPENLKQLIEWMPKVGYNTLVVPTNYQGHDRVKWDNFRIAATTSLLWRDITIEVGGHGYQNFLNASMENGTLLQKHPEYFGQDAAGKRRADDHSVFCTSNPDAVRYLTDNFLAYVKDRPEIQIYDFWPPDGAKWCECEKCKSLGTPSGRQAILLGQVKQSLANVRPDLRLEMIAYSSYVTPPQHATVDPSVLVDFCPINQSFNWQINDARSDRNAAYARDLSAWRKRFTGDISIYSYYRKYAWDSLPVVIPHYMQRDLQCYATLPTQGVSTYSEPGDWFTYELNHYVLAALAWDPTSDVDALVRKFAAARYGSSADVAVAAYVALEDVVRTTCSLPYTPRKSAGEIEAGAKRLGTAKEGVVAAISSAPDGPPKFNLGRLALTLDYAIGDLQLLQLAAAKDTAGARARAHQLFKLISDHADDGVFLSRDGRLNENRLLSRTATPAKASPAPSE